MIARKPRYLAFLGALALSGGGFAHAQEHCPAIQFDPGAAQPERLTVERIEGEGLAAPAAHPERVGHAGNICLALFREPSRAQVASAVTERDGAFRFEDPGTGDYVLIARPMHGELASVRVPLHVVAVTAAQRGLFIRVNVDGSGTPGSAGIIQDAQLRRQLLDRVKVDQDIRMEIIRKDITKRSPELDERMKSIDAETDVMLRKIVGKQGWPGTDLAGLDGASAASTMLMHVPPVTQKQMLPLVEAAFRRGTVSGATYAMLFDHVRIADGQPQRYGTVAKPFTAEREVVFFPIEDEATVDARRAQMGLPPLAEYRELMKEMYLSQKK